MIFAKGGLSSKNCPNFTEESLLLANRKEYIKGLYLDVFLTKDNIIIPVNNNDKIICKQKNKLCKLDYIDVKKVNIGTKIKRNYILNINDIFKIQDINYIIINLEGNNINIIDKIKELASKNTQVNFYITSSNKEILEKLFEENKNYKIGIFVDDTKDLSYSCDFYIINNIHLLKDLDKLFNQNKTIFINNINTKNDLNKILNYSINYNIISIHPNALINKL